MATRTNASLEQRDRNAPSWAPPQRVFRNSTLQPVPETSCEHAAAPPPNASTCTSPTNDAMQSDEALMALVRAGDADAFQLLVRRHTRGLQRFAQRLLRRPDDADDVTQDVLLRVWQHARSWQDERVLFTTWLYRIAHNLCVDRLRKQQRQRTDLMSPADMTDLVQAHTQSAPDAAFGNAALGQRLTAALTALPERQRSALVLCFYQGFNNQQAADVLNVSIDAVESLLARARRSLRVQLTSAAQSNDAVLRR